MRLFNDFVNEGIIDPTITIEPKEVRELHKKKKARTFRTILESMDLLQIGYEVLVQSTNGPQIRGMIVKKNKSKGSIKLNNGWELTGGNLIISIQENKVR